MTADRIPVLMYHRIGHASNPWEQKLCVSPENFRGHMHKLASKGFTACSIDDFFHWLDGNTELPGKSVLITFDDGYSGVYQHAFPVLQKLNWTATTFLVSGLLGEQDAWCRDENPSGQSHPLMSPGEIRTMHAEGFSFHSHSRNHADLTQLDRETLENELRGSREDLESLLDIRVPYIAYPYGRHNDNVINAVKQAGYSAGFCVKPGFNRHDVDRFAIRRMDIYGTDTPTQLLRKATYGINKGTWRESLKYYAKQVWRKLNA